MAVEIVENYLRKKGRCRDAEMLASALLVVLLSPGSGLLLSVTVSDGVNKDALPCLLERINVLR